MKKRSVNWTREELILALNLYLKLPFGKLHSRNKAIIRLSQLIGRSPNAVAMRLNNFASIDPFHQSRGIKGLTGGKKQVQPVWDEFIHHKENLLFESERILAEKEGMSIEKKFSQDLVDLENIKGETKLREVKTRVNQSVFRQIVVANYSGKCAISGINIPDFLVASHIIPWSKNEKERLNPANGICFSVLYDRAFDKGYIGLDNNYSVLVSTDLRQKSKEPYYRSFFNELSGMKITLPQKYMPERDFLQYHRDVIFKG
ncbi:MAG TPA: HNH endonuclease [Bacteroidia bacterium]|nr:HNH endonuclease [Bacteroidia bacterium]